MENTSGSKGQKKMALGRGLDSLIPSFGLNDFDDDKNANYFECGIELIQPNRYQARQNFAEDEMEDLCNSIKEQGVIQPVLVRKLGDKYELIAGERRLRASKMAGLSLIPVIIKDISDAALMEMSIVENVQRQDLNPIEEAMAYQSLINEFKLTQEQIAKKVGKSRPSIANILRLLQLPEEIKDSIKEGALSMGHARALLGAENPIQQNMIWNEVISNGLSVRETEALINKLKSKPEPEIEPEIEAEAEAEPEKSKENKEKEPEDPYYVSIVDNLSRQFGTKVQIKKKGERGKVEIEFYSNDDLDRLLTIFNNNKYDDI
ncbi:MAG: ParB/RepB/Spo0J family partition protein [Desulfobacterales bacterium]|nr:ParB/RepB/Spo0J family partition protein [Desulfobacterales bacterium]